MFFMPGSKQPTVWGDGFATDGWSSLNSVQSAEDLNEDEYGRLFPQLAGRALSELTPLLLHLTRVVAALEYPKQDARSRQSAGRNASDLLFLQDLLLHLRDEQMPPRLDDDDRAYFAFLTRVHPGYFWAESLITAERDAAAAWLGVLGSGRPAFMTIEVADYFIDVSDQRTGSPFIRDPFIAALVSRVIDLTDLLKAARERRQGHTRIVIGRHPAVSHPRRRRIISFAVRAFKRCANIMSPLVTTP